MDGPFKVLARYNNNAYKIDLLRDKYNVSDIFNVKDLSPYHGDEEFDSRSDLPQGRGDDAEHPKIITMDLPTSPTTPLGPMTRAGAKAIKDKVNSLLSELPLSMHENWLLPQVETLCVIGCLEEGHRPTTLNGQDGEDAKFMGQEEELLEVLRLRTSDNLQAPDVRPPSDDRRFHTRAKNHGLPMPHGRSTPRRPTEDHPS